MEKNQLNEMKSLIDRMNNPRTGWGTLLEGKEPATQVLAPNALEFLSRNFLNEGAFCALGYIQLYPVRGTTPDMWGDLRNIDPTEFSTDRGRETYTKYVSPENSEWDTPTGRKLPGGGPTMANKIYSYVIKVSRYSMHWQAEKGYANAQARRSKGLADITSNWSDAWKQEVGYSPEIKDNGEPYEKNGVFFMDPHKQIGVATYGKKTRDDMGNITMEPIKSSYLEDPNNPDSGVEYEKNYILNRLSKKEDNFGGIYFGVYENGDIDPIPGSLGKFLGTQTSSHRFQGDGVDVEKDNAFKSYYDYLDNENFLQKSFLTSNVAYICAKTKDMSSGTEKSRFWVNKSPLFLLAKTVNKQKINYVKHVNEDELESALKIFAEKEANDLEKY